MEPLLQLQIAEALRKRRDELRTTQKDILQRLKWPDSQKGLLSKIEGGVVPIPWGAIASLASVYRFDPVLMFILRAAAELADPKLQESLENQALLNSILELVGVQPGREARELLSATTARTLVSEVNQHAVNHSIVTPWTSELHGRAVMPAIQLGIQNSCYRETSSREWLQKPGVLALVSPVSHGIGLQVVELLRTLREEPLKDRLIVIVESEDLRDEGDFHQLIRNAIQHTLTLMGKVGQISTIFPQESQSINDIPATVLVLKADHLADSYRGLASDGKHTLVFQFDDSEKAARFCSLNPLASVATIALIKHEEAVSVLESELLRMPTSSLRSESFLSRPYWQILRQPSLLFATLTALRKSPSILPSRSQVLDAAEKQFQWEASPPNDLAETLSDDIVQEVSTPRAVDKPVFTLLVEDATPGRALATLINSGSPTELGGRIQVVLAPYSLVLSALNASVADACEIRPDIVVVQHYAQFLTHLATGRFTPLGQLPHDATHSQFASICRRGDRWYGAPFRYPTKITAFRKFVFAPGQEPTNWATIPATLATSGNGSRLLLQLAKNHPSLYYEWLGIVLGMGGCDISRSLDGDLMILLDSPQTIAATQKFQQLIQPRFTHPESKNLDWYSISDAFSDLGDAVAMCFPFSDSLAELIKASERRRNSAPTGMSDQDGYDTIGWCHLPTCRVTDGLANELTKNVLGSSGFPMHPSTMHIVACLNSHAVQATEALLLWLHGAARRDLSWRSLEPETDKIIELAERYLLPPVVQPKNLVNFNETAGLAEYQAATLQAIEKIVHKNAPVEQTLRATATELRRLI